MIIVKGMSAMCSSCGHGINYYSRWIHSHCSIASDDCLEPDDPLENRLSVFADKCLCNEPIPEPDTENYHHCYKKDLIDAGFPEGEAEFLTSMTYSTIEEWRKNL